MGMHARSARRMLALRLWWRWRCESAISYTQIQDNRDAFITWIGLLTGIWQWNFDDTANAATLGFPDELGADLLRMQKTGMLMVTLQITRSI